MMRDIYFLGIFGMPMLNFLNFKKFFGGKKFINLDFFKLFSINGF
jgi:hypothetical protein